MSIELSPTAQQCLRLAASFGRIQEASHCGTAALRGLDWSPMEVIQLFNVHRCAANLNNRQLFDSRRHMWLRMKLPGSIMVITNNRALR
jgi:hypothetical protein